MTASWITCGPTWIRRPPGIRFGVVAIVVAQEFQWVTGARNRSPKPRRGQLQLRQGRAAAQRLLLLRATTVEFGAGFIKICSYFPYPAVVWLNGHERAKRQAGGYAALLANGFATCPETARLGRSATVSGRPTRRRSSTGGRR